MPLIVSTLQMQLQNAAQQAFIASFLGTTVGFLDGAIIPSGSSISLNLKELINSFIYSSSYIFTIFKY